MSREKYVVQLTDEVFAEVRPRGHEFRARGCQGADLTEG